MKVNFFLSHNISTTLKSIFLCRKEFEVENVAGFSCLNKFNGDCGRCFRKTRSLLGGKPKVCGLIWWESKMRMKNVTMIVRLIVQVLCGIFYQ